MTRRLILLIGVLLIIIVVVAGGTRFYRQLTRSVRVEGSITASVVTIPASDELSGETSARVAARLRAVGLSDNGAIDSTGVETHLQRLQDGEVDANTLLLYADDLEALNQFTAAAGVQIPTDFWDSQTDFHQSNGVDE